MLGNQQAAAPPPARIWLDTWAFEEGSPPLSRRTPFLDPPLKMVGQPRSAGVWGQGWGSKAREGRRERWDGAEGGEQKSRRAGSDRLGLLGVVTVGRWSAAKVRSRAVPRAARRFGRRRRGANVGVRRSEERWTSSGSGDVSEATSRRGFRTVAPTPRSGARRSSATISRTISGQSFGTKFGSGLSHQQENPA